MKRKPATDLLAGNPGRGALGEWLDFSERLYAQTGAAVGQIATEAHDEALYLLLHTLGLPLDSDASVLARRLTAAERDRVVAVLRRRLIDRVPAAYLTREAWLGPHRFYVDERVIIPRSYFLEIISELGRDARPACRGAAQRRRVPTLIADVCTGSACLAILLAHQFPQAKVDAVDLSPEALAVAEINVRAHRLTRRVHLHESDVFDAVPVVKYDLIVSNPPYEPSAFMAGLPEEFKHEPRMALDGGADGLDIIRKLLRQARDRLQPHGRVLIEVGGLRKAVDREFAALRPRWLRTADGANCVCEITAPYLAKSYSA